MRCRASSSQPLDFNTHGSSDPTVVTPAVDIINDPSCIMSMDPDLVLCNSLGRISPCLSGSGGSIGHPDQYSQIGNKTLLY